MAADPGRAAEFEGLLDRLAADEHDGAQWLLYEALTSAETAHANRAFDLLVEGDYRLSCGYTCSPWWTTRQLLQAISPGLSEEQVAALEAIFIDLRPEWEDRPGGYSSFTLLSALPKERLSEKGRRRLGELRRAAGQDQPDEPMGTQVGRIGSPIPQRAVPHMTDDQWLKAIAKHSGSRVTWSSFTGGAEELAHVLKAEAARQPERCARLALRLDASSHPAYLNGILQGLNETQEDLPPELVFDAIRHAASLDRPDHDRWIPYALHGRYDQDIPDDIIELILDKTLNSPDPSDDAWQRGGSPGQRLYGGDPLANGINTARGAGALALGDLLVHDADGHRTALVEPSFEALAADPSVAVRSCIAHVLAAGLRHARESAVAAVATLIDAPDALLATRLVDDLIVYVGFGDSARVEPIITRMISSELAETRESGGRLAAFAGLELELPDLLSDAVGSADVRTRMGAAAVCAQRVPVTADVAAATGALDVLMEDRESEVREAAAAVAGALRNHPLAPNRPLIGRLIASSAFDRALFQLLITLDEATERVDDLVLATARRFLDLHGGELSSMATRAAGESREIGQLVLRAYVQAPDAAGRAAALDLIDELLTKAAYGLDEQVGDAER